MMRFFGSLLHSLRAQFLRNNSDENNSYTESELKITAFDSKFDSKLHSIFKKSQNRNLSLRIEILNR